MSDQNPYGEQPPTAPGGPPTQPPPPPPPAPSTNPYGQPPTPGGGQFGAQPGGPGYPNQPYQQPYAQPPGGSGGGSGKKTGLIIGIVVAVLVVIGGLVIGLLVARGADKSPEATSSSESTATSGEPTDQPSNQPSDQPSDAPTDDPEPTGSLFQGAGYAYTLPDGWQDVTAQVLADSPAGAIDSATADGETIAASNMNLIVETGSAGGETDPEAIRELWESNIVGAAGQAPESIDGITIGGEDAIGVSLARTNEFGVDVEQYAYLTIHDGSVYSLILSTTAAESDAAEGILDDVLETWAWD